MDTGTAGSDRVELVIDARRDEIARVAAALDQLAARLALPRDAVADMQVALDEVLVNVVSYAYPEAGEHRIGVVLRARPQALEAEVTDDGTPFDPLAAAPPQRDAPLERRSVGGLGIHFVRSLMSEVIYDRIGSQNRLLLRRLLRAGNQDGPL